MRQAGARLAGVVVKLHQAEDEVGGHQLESVRGIGDDIPAGEGGASETCRAMTECQCLNRSPLRALALSVEVGVSETVDAEAEHVVGLQGFTEEVAIATAILPETERDRNHTSIRKKHLMTQLYKVAISRDIKCTHLHFIAHYQTNASEPELNLHN